MVSQRDVATPSKLKEQMDCRLAALLNVPLLIEGIVISLQFKHVVLIFRHNQI